MVSGWFVFIVVTCIVICSGFVVAVAVLRASWASREREALTSTDLRALEESAMVLIEQLKAEADSGIGELDKRCAELKELISEADRKISQLKNISAESYDFMRKLPDEACVASPIIDTEAEKSCVKVLDLASKGMECAEIARTVGLDAAEVNLILSLGLKAR
ncbi:MAG: hypothetical protein ABFD64_09135 [Armatimonadota bacterium]